MKFHIAIEPGTETTAFGVVVPDLPGCFSAGDTLAEAKDNAREAIEFWCQSVTEDGGEVPVLKSLAEHQVNPDYSGWIWAEVEVTLKKRLNDLIEQCDPQSPMPEDTKAWEESAPVGKEAQPAGGFDKAVPTSFNKKLPC